MASNSVTNNNVVGFIPLLMLSLLVLATSTAGQLMNIDIKLDKQVMCSSNGNLPALVNGGTIVGAANANATLKCGSQTIGNAVSNESGLVSINATVGAERIDDLAAGRCTLGIDLPVPGCIALNTTGVLQADVSLLSINAGSTSPIHISMSACNFISG